MRSATASDNGAKKKTRKVKKMAVIVNISNCKYPVVTEAVTKLGWRTSNNEKQTDFNVWWQDWSVGPERVMKLESFQRLNHFPGMYQICRKGDLARSICRMARCFGREFSIVPRTWVLPEAFSSFKAHIMERDKKGQRKKPIIVKPVAACQGKGIFLTTTWRDVSQTEPVVAQQYIARPLLIDGLKFDLRIYALVTSVDPLRILIYEEGIVRLCTVKYKEPTAKNMGQTRMHLTNYAINKASDNFVQAADAAAAGSEDASKRSLGWFFGWLEAQGLDREKQLWPKIWDLIIKTVISVQPSLKHTYRSCVPSTSGVPTSSSRGGSYSGSHPYRLSDASSRGAHSFFAGDAFAEPDNELGGNGGSQPPQNVSRCFEILGFDVLVDRKLRPWLLEVNHSPSFACDSGLDHSIKLGLVENTLRLLNLAKSDRRQWQTAMQAQAQSRLYSGISPFAAFAPPPANERQSSAAAYMVPARENQRPPPKRVADAAKKWVKYARNESKVLQSCNYSVIYPPSDAAMQEKYALMLQVAEDMFHHGSDPSQVSQVQKRIADHLASITSPLARSASGASSAAESSQEGKGADAKDTGRGSSGRRGVEDEDDEDDDDDDDEEEEEEEEEQDDNVARQEEGGDDDRGHGRGAAVGEGSADEALEAPPCNARGVVAGSDHQSGFAGFSTPRRQQRSVANVEATATSEVIRGGGSGNGGGVESGRGLTGGVQLPPFLTPNSATKRSLKHGQSPRPSDLSASAMTTLKTTTTTTTKATKTSAATAHLPPTAQKIRESVVCEAKATKTTPQAQRHPQDGGRRGAKPPASHTGRRPSSGTPTFQNRRRSFTPTN